MDTMEAREYADYFADPFFTVRGGKIHRVNEAASRLLIRTGSPVEELIQSGLQDYLDFTGGWLCVTLSLYGSEHSAAITRKDGEDLFFLRRQEDDESLRALALAAMELRMPLSDAMLAANRLAKSDAEPAAVSRLNRNLYRILRIVSNMSDTHGYRVRFRMDPYHMNALFREITKKAAALSADSGIELRYLGLDEEVTCPVDGQVLERAVLNMIGNSMKFTPKGGSITVQLSRTGTHLKLQVSDTGCGISEEIWGTLFTRFLREPALEDPRHGLGLGMSLIREAAASHGGTVLVDRPEGTGTRITLSLPIRNPELAALHADRFFIDYAGELDHTRIELSDFLPNSEY